MLCFKRFSYLFVFVFSVFACTLLSITITSGDVYAEAHTWSYQWGQYNASNRSVPAIDGHIPDNTFCGYKYFYIKGNSQSLVFNLVNNNSNSGISLPSVSNVSFSELYGSFSMYGDNNSITNCAVDPFYMGLYVVLSDEPIINSPSGSLSITENGTYDVTNFASAVVDVPPIYGDYHDDLVNIKKAIYTGCAVLLVLYFFYCIYRMIIKGVKK